MGLNSTLCTNASIRKLRIKLLSRAALRLLPVRPRVSLRKGQRSCLRRSGVTRANEVRKVVSCT
jgi:hypothetical protein